MSHNYFGLAVVLSFIVGTVGLSFLSLPAHGEAKQCSQYRHIDELHVHSADLLSTFKWYLTNDPPGTFSGGLATQGREEIVVNSAETFVAYLRGFQDQCIQFSRLVINVHGFEGSLYFQNKSKTTGSVLSLETISLLDGLEDVMAADAKIDVMSCWIAKGCGGQTFLVNLARRLLAKRGGVLKASPTPVVSHLPGVIRQVPEGWEWIYLTVDPAKSYYSWEGPVLSKDDCSSQFLKMAGKLKRLEKRFGPCGKSHEILRARQKALNAFESIIRTNSFRGVSNGRAMQVAEEAFDELIEQFKNAECAVE